MHHFRRSLILGQILLTACLASGAPKRKNAPPAKNATATVTDEELKAAEMKRDWNKTLLYHWGTPDANKLLLSLGGYDFRGQTHNADLGDGRSAAYNEAVNNQLRQWYSVNKRDMAGEGLYLSTLPADTANFGPDLLVAEFVDAPADYGLPSVDPAKFKELSDAVILAGKTSALPYAVTYNASGWIVVTRSPRAGEPRLIFRPPSAADVERAYESLVAAAKVVNHNVFRPNAPPSTSITVERSLIEAMKEVGQVLNQLGDTPKTRSSDFFLRRLFFDRFDQALHEEILPHALARKDSHALLAIFSLLETYRKFIPDDARTKALESFAIEHRDLLAPRIVARMVRRSPVTDPALAIALKLYPADWGRELVKELIALPVPTKDPLSLTNFLLGLREVKPEAFDTEADRALHQRVSQMLQNPPPKELVEASAVVRAIAKDFSDDVRTEDWLLAALHMLGQQNDVFMFTPTDMKTRIVHWEEEVFPLLLASPARAKYADAIADMAAGLFEVFLPTDPATKVMPWNMYSFRPMLEWWSWLRKADAGAFAKFAATIETRMKDPALVKRWLDVGGHLTWPGYANGQKPDGDVRRMTELSASVPSLRALVVDRLIQDFQNEKLVEDTLAAQQMSRIERQKDLLERERPGLLTIVYQALTARVRKDQPVDSAKVLKAVFPAQLPRAQSDFAKIFPLVDPIFVSEKIRHGHMAPQLAFNYPYSADGKNYTQPAWENFVETWNFVAMNLPGVSPDDLGKLLARADGMLLDGFVDRTISPEGGNWNRSKYKTVIHGDDWKTWAVENNRAELEKYFHIESSGADYLLTFKSVAELGLSAPADGGTQADVILKEIARRVEAEKDPIKKAAKVLHLMTKMHPNENGNGRLGRLWASVILLEAGYSVPAGLPSQDFLLSEDRLAWEIRRSLVAGKFFEKLLVDSVRRKIPTTRFFTDVYRGSAEEGVVTLTATNFDELKTLVREMESWKAAPDWAKTVAERLGVLVGDAEKTGGPILQSDEMVRADLLARATREGRAAPVRCEALFR